MSDAPKEAIAPTGAAARFQIGPPIDKILAVPANLDGLTPLQAADCFLKSEEFYVERALRVASEMETRLRFHVKLNKTILLESEIAPLFLNLQQVYAFNRKLYSELLRLRLHGDIVAGVGQCMITHIPFFKLYGSYIREYRKAQAFIDILLEKKRKFLDWLDLNELCCGYSLKQLLLAPVSRMPQYLIFLGAIVRSLDPESASAEKLLAAVAAVSKVTDDIAQGLKDEVSRKLVVTLQARIFGNNCNLVSPHRFVVKHSDLKKMYNRSLFGGSSKVYIFVLFNDALIYGTRPGRLTSGSIKHVLPLVGLTVEDERDDDSKKIKNGWKINSATKSFVVCAANGPTKGTWMQALRAQVALANASASSLQKSVTAADEFERLIKNKPTSASSSAAAAAAAQQQRSPQSGTGAAGSSTAQVRTTIPIQQPNQSSTHRGGSESPSRNSASVSANSQQTNDGGNNNGPPLPPPSFGGGGGGGYGGNGGPPPPPGAPFGANSGSPPPPPPGNPYGAGAGSPPPPPPMGNPYSSSSGAAPPAAPPRPPPSQGGYGPGTGPPPPPPMAPPSFYNAGASSSQHGEEDHSYASGSTYQDEYSAPEAPTLQYDIPVVGAAAPPPPPMFSPAASAAPAAPKVDLLSQIQAGKALRAANAAPEWTQVLDTNSGAYYYENSVTGESVWEAPASFTPAAGGGVGSKAVNNGGGAQQQGLEDKLKSTLDRYRQFVQDEEDDVAECGDDEWD